ncbi:hypothetical protein RIF29_13268 [Crotalaria pallida]|uniref:F-box domain-containing protein n=1 Tax=Crotalaria pallida TaxID=3830 RepID=A0AAN9IP22_CROPI
MATLADDTTTSSQWSLLPYDILHEITLRIDKPRDYVRLGAVCKGWLSFVHRNFNQKHLLHIYQNNPLLLIPSASPQESRGLYNITQGIVYDQFQIHLPHKRCCGSSYGWLFFVEKVNDSTMELILLNPFLGYGAKPIKLPPLKFCAYEHEVNIMDEYGVCKAILSKDPWTSPDDYEVVAMYGTFGELAHYKAGDNFWSYAEKMDRQVFADVIFYKDLILAVDRYNWIVKFTLEQVERGIIRTTNYNTSPWYLKWHTIHEQLPFGRPFYAGNAYFAEDSRGDLLLARRYYRNKNELEAQEDDQEQIANTKEFKVYKLYFSSKKLKMKMFPTKKLYGETLFVGDNHSISVPTSKYPCLRPNSIYYTDDYIDVYKRNLGFGTCDTGVFSIKHGSFGENFVPTFSTKDKPPPIFVVPR